jgi:hypothetical protein
MRRLYVILLAVVLLFAAGACRGVKPQASAAPAASAATPAAADASAFTGTVAEALNAGGYTYVRLQAAGKDDVWIAANEFPTKAGERLTVALEMPMQNFESKTLNRTFPLVYFVGSVSRDGQVVAGAPAEGGTAPSGGPALMTSHAPAATPTAVTEPIAPAPGGLSIADIWAKRKDLAGKDVIVRGKVVKVNNQILQRNWIHLQDGTGSATERTNDLTITTDADVKVGDTITISGVLAIGKEFGAGYGYDAIVENAKIIK